LHPAREPPAKSQDDQRGYEPEAVLRAKLDKGVPLG